MPTTTELLKEHFAHCNQNLAEAREWKKRFEAAGEPVPLQVLNEISAYEQLVEAYLEAE
jgi:hypothetical protein